MFLLFKQLNTTAQISKSFDGVWVGQGYQINNNGTWSIKLTIKGENIKIEYPSLGCEAVLTKISSESKKLYLSEKISNNGNCVDNGRVELEWLTPNEIRYKWSFSDGEVGSFSTLIKF